VEIAIRGLVSKDIQLLHTWFNEPHVKKFYSLRDWTQEEVEQKYQDYFNHETDVMPYIALYEGVPFGYMQRYPIKNHPWKGQDFPKDITENAAGIDFFIGDKDYLKKGFARIMIDAFLEEHIFIDYKYCIADPAIDNKDSIQLLEKIGFSFSQDIVSEDALGRSRAYRLMLLQENSDSSAFALV